MKPNPEMCSLPVEVLKMDPALNRPLIEADWRAMVDDFNERGLQVIQVSERMPGRPLEGELVILDGQHRCRAVLELYGRDHRLPRVLVWRDLTWEQENELIAIFNSHHVPAMRRRHAWNVAGGKTLPSDVDRLLDEFELRGKIHSYKVLYGLQRAGHLRPVLTVLREAWGASPDAYKAAMLGATADVLERHPDIDRERLAKALKAWDGKAVALLADARASRRRKSIRFAVARLLVEAYNGTRHKDKLEAWT